jgi:hypothetical protein
MVARKAKLGDLTIPDLVSHFEALALAQSQAQLEDDMRKVKRTFFLMSDIADELKSRPGDQRQALVALYDHPHIHVRLKAVKKTLALEPIRGRRLLEEIAKSGDFPDAGEAGMSIRNLDDGIFRPT